MHTDYNNVYMGNIIIILSTHPLSFRRVKPVLFTTLEFNACKKIYTHLGARAYTYIGTRDVCARGIFIIYYF